jgi:hypothetical protein
MTPWTMLSKAVTSASGSASLRTALFVVLLVVKSAMFFLSEEVHQNLEDEKNPSGFFEFQKDSLRTSFLFFPFVEGWYTILLLVRVL